MKKLLVSIVFGLLLSLFNTQPVFAILNEEITNFNSKITINQDTSLIISEEINYTTTLSKHGIYRYIPISYNKDGQKEVLRISDIKVTDGENNKVNYSRTNSSQFLTLKIGDPDITFSGDKKYLISYSVERALNRFDDHVELYWDITGEGWQIPISSSTAIITSTFADINKIDCFSGVVGSDDNLCETSFDKGSASFIYPQTIDYGDNFTVLIGLDKDNQLQFPTPSQLFFLWLKYNWPIFLTPLPLLFIFFYWYRHGRDISFISANVYNLDSDRPTRLSPISFRSREPFVYAPLKDLSPGEAGALIDEKVDTRDVISEILELARKKYLKIEVIETKKLFGKNRDYKFTKLYAGNKELTKVQSFLLEKLFAGKEVVNVSELKGKFYTTIESARSQIEQSLVDKKIYSKKPTTVKITGILIYMLMTFVVGGIIMVNLFTLGIYWPLIALVIQLPFGLLLAYNLPQKSAVGTNLWLQTRGLRKSINYGKWREEVKEKNLFIEEVLPFAVSLGVINKLSKDMKELGIEPPEYLHTANLTTWSTAQFINSFSNEVGSSLSYNPSSSSSSGRSGFSGGGSSGGGGGGGGGGSW
ncbi:MAG: DUF2207 domain-containing protein [Candidatus Pacebacteria bacterium]|nr:DUF2207 domain-containing protein [Candidatus Paceibacterota bacterium]